MYHAPHMLAFCFLHFAPLLNELCKVAPWEGIGIAHLIKELLEINAALLGAPVGVCTGACMYSKCASTVRVCVCV